MAAFRGLFLMLFAAMFGFMGLQMGSVGRAPGAGPKTAAKKEPAVEKKGGAIAEDCPALLPLAGYLGLEDKGCPGEKGVWEEKTWQEAMQGRRVRGMGALIATIPDPDTVTLAHYSGQSVESLRRAAERCGYGPDRHWFPWFGEQEEESRRKFSPRNNHPGSLLFRRTEGEETELLVVLLVSETPTRGVHRPAFDNALQLAGAVQRNGHPLRVVGPSYSGSAASLRQALEARKKGFSTVTLITGTATSPELRRILSGPWLQFSSVIENDAEAGARLRDFLGGRRNLRDSTAVVTEEGTAYAEGLRTGGAGERAVAYTFPMEISQVRIAYQKDPELQESGGKAGERRTGLALRFSEEQPGYESIPNWAGETGAIAKEFVLRRLGDQIAEQNPSIIKIGASDVRDVLFVGGFLRKRFDDAQLVLLDADVLYGNTARNLNMRGALSIATYPLLLEAQRWEGGDRLMQFPSQFAHGVFNALAAHLKPDAMVQYSAVSGAKHPPLWLTVYSRGSNWPVALLAGSGGKETSLREARQGAVLTPKLGRQHGGWIILESGLLVLTGAWAFVLLSTGVWPGLWKRARTDAALAVPLFVVTGALLALHALAGPVQWFYLLSGSAWGSQALVLGMGNLSGVAALAFVLYRLAGRLGRGQGQLTAALVAASVIAAGWIATLIPKMKESEGGYDTALFYVHRAYHISSGVSPVVPLVFFLALITLGGLSQLASRWIAYWLSVRVQTGPEKWQRTKDVTAAGCRRALGFAAGWTVLSLYLFRMGSVSTLEHPRYTQVFLVLFAGAVTFLGYSFLRLICLFWELRTLMSYAGGRHLPEHIKPVAEMKVWGVWRFHFRNIAVDSLPSPEENNVLRYAQCAQTMIQMAQCQVFFLIGGILLGLFAMQSYPFEPSRTFINYISFFFLLIGAGTLFIFSRIESAPFLSELYGTEDKSALRFYWKTLSRFGLPLLAVLAAQFPDLGDLLVKVLTPFLESGIE
ncbi:MAG: hypothetical protein JNK48_27765 [Bryobacterales bacterium]|nr:hypothetical protein [Bryobacterales bacterium]